MKKSSKRGGRRMKNRRQRTQNEEQRMKNIEQRTEDKAKTQRIEGEKQK